MKTFCSSAILTRAVVCLGVAFIASAACAQSLHIESELIWATDDAQSPDPTHHPIAPDLAKQLGQAPYRWKNYFEVNRQIVDIGVGETKKITMSKRCILEIKNLDTNRIEVKLHGDGKPVSTHKESLAKNWRLILSGDAGNQTAWLVSLRKTDPTSANPPVATSAPPVVTKP